MPIYANACAACGREIEEIRHLSEPDPECCGAKMQRVPQLAGMAYRSRTGKWYGHSMPGKKWIGGGRPRPKTIGRGHGLGGRRKPPSIREAIAVSGQATEIRALAKGKT